MDREDAALPRRTLDADTPAMGLHRLLDEAETKTAAANLLGFCSLASVKRLEEMGLLVHWNPVSPVAHGDLDG